MSVMKILLITFCAIEAEIVQFSRFKRVDDCVDYRTHCNPSTDIPCRQKNNVCAQIPIFHNIYIFICLKPLHLGDFCEENVDCLMLGNARCHEGHCECMPNNGIMDKGTKCLPIIGGTCLTNTDCTVENTICVDNECQCKDKYIAIDNNQCTLSTLGNKCRGDLNCNNQLHMKCSKYNICRCKSNYTVVDNIQCAPLLEEFCWSEEKCAPKNSVCSDHKCKCLKITEHLAIICAFIREIEVALTE